MIAPNARPADAPARRETGGSVQAGRAAVGADPQVSGGGLFGFGFGRVLSFVVVLRG